MLTSPLGLDDYLGLLDPLLCARWPAGRVTAVRPETADATTLSIRPGRGWAGHRAGQYVPVGVRIDGTWHWRTYSLTCPPGGKGGLLTITVKATPGGRVSPLLAHGTERGDLLRLGPAQGDFTLADPLPPRLLMVTGGSGITPVMGLLRSLTGAGGEVARPAVTLLHSAPGPRESIFRGELRAMDRTLPWFHLHEHHTRSGPEHTGHLTPEHIARLCPDWRERETWVCGPTGLLDSVTDHWSKAGLDGRLHAERFQLAPASPPSPKGEAGSRVLFTRTGAEAVADASTPLLAVGEAAGVRMPYGCRRGICFGCLTPLTYGRVRDLRNGELSDRTGQLIQTCVSAAAGPLALDA
ncbi:ferredoxin reductase [Streptomyces sp. N35]|uniref:ferredoxin reductase n=1 Tax=Streptomyces sp. N35 TaxID=2795730 RepID=UPI0018F7AC70|nr:ferredoxin reductase [Streptomyces sp. N35]